MKKNNRSNKRSQQSLKLAPPPISVNPIRSLTLRFVASNALVHTPITDTDLMDLICMASGATAAYRLFGSFRLNRVKVWGPMASNLTPVTISLQFPAVPVPGFSGPTKLLTDTSIGSVRCAHINATVPRATYAFQWQTYTVGAGNQLFYLDGPVNTIVDVTFQYVLFNNFDGVTGSIQVNAAVSGATAGIIYIRALDSNGLKYLVPQGFPTV